MHAGTVFKRFDPTKLFVLVGQDVTERFHLLLSLLFVVVEVGRSIMYIDNQPSLTSWTFWHVFVSLGH